MFADGQVTANIDLVLLADNVPELDEDLTIDLLQATLDAADVAGPYAATSPRLSSGSTSSQHVIIAENDNARGVLEFEHLSPQVLATEAGTVGPFLRVQRSAGLFGAVAVEYFTLTPVFNGANLLVDVVNATGVVHFAPGQATADVPLAIVDDTEPEFAEFFDLVLTAPQGGAVLGTRTATTVEIAENDDPYGVVGFADLSPPVALEPSNVTLLVRRAAGTQGLVTVRWAVAAMPAGPAQVQPLLGQLVLAPGAATAELQLRVLADQVPEDELVLSLILDQVDGGARLDPQRSALNLTLAANDNPFGTFGFAAAFVQRAEGQTVTLTIERTGGLLGQVDVAVAPVAMTELDYVRNTPPFSLDDVPELFIFALFNNTLQDRRLLNSFFQVAVASAAECLELCLARPQCRSLSVSSQLCSLSAGTIFTTGPLVVANGFTYYQLRPDHAQRTADHLVDVNADLTFAQPLIVTFAPGQMAANVSLTVTDDRAPELDESCFIQLLGVQPAPYAYLASPELDAQAARVHLRIPASDDPYGLLDIDLAASILEVEEVPGAAARVVVVRRQGQRGTVAVAWALDCRSTPSWMDRAPAL